MSYIQKQCFSAVGPRVWNTFSSYLWKDMNYRHFKHALKGLCLGYSVNHGAL